MMEVGILMAEMMVMGVIGIRTRGVGLWIVVAVIWL